MSNTSRSRASFGPRPRFDFVSELAERERCIPAEQFQAWCKRLIGALPKDAEEAMVNVAKLRLLDKYMDYRASLGPDCRDTITGNDHICLFQVFVEAYEQLQELELSAAPPPLRAPEQPPPSLPSSREIARLIQEAQQHLYIPTDE